MPNPPSTSTRGLVCRTCGGRTFSVLYTRSRHGYIIRNRQCKKCGKRMLTQERPAGER